LRGRIELRDAEGHALVVGAVGLRCALIALQVDPIAAYVLTPCRIDGLALGGLLALAWYRQEAWERVRRVAPIVMLVGGALLMAITVGRGQFHHEDPVVQSAGYTVLAISFAALIALFVGPSANLTLAKVGIWGWMRTTGKYSYAMYLFHPLLIASPINDLVYGRLMPDGIASAAGVVVWILFGLVETFLAAWVSWHCWEKYFLSLKRYFAEAPHVRSGGGLRPPRIYVPEESIRASAAGAGRV
jgi:peptidoglycan/LPS O-acetylase OafA/YrhL